MVEKLMGPIGDLAMIILLSIPRTQLPSKFVFLYPYISAAFRAYQRSGGRESNNF